MKIIEVIAWAVMVVVMVLYVELVFSAIEYVDGMRK